MRTLSGFAIVCGSLWLSIAGASAAERTGFVEKTFKGEDGKTVEYVVFIPHDYDGKKTFPVILFLHGAGEKYVRGAEESGRESQVHRVPRGRPPLLGPGLLREGTLGLVEEAEEGMTRSDEATVGACDATRPR
jgi:hypothetical protein